MISKELLSEILGFEVSGFCLALNETFIEVYDDSRDERISIYELAFECKKWAFTRGYELMSGTIDEGSGELIFECSIYNKNAETKEEYILSTFEGYSEPEVIFKASQWILENYKAVK